MFYFWQKIAETNKLADSNYEKLKVESTRLEKHSQTCNWWIWLMLALVVITFLSMIVFMKLFPKKPPVQYPNYVDELWRMFIVIDFLSLNTYVLIMWPDLCQIKPGSSSHFYFVISLNVCEFLASTWAFSISFNSSMHMCKNLKYCGLTLLKLFVQHINPFTPTDCFSLIQNNE